MKKRLDYMNLFTIISIFLQTALTITQNKKITRDLFKNRKKIMENQNNNTGNSYKY